ncbi:endolytic transglycosylase MltG [Legionella pneumophila]|nr:endolytic transglycosylase MltG [Legionella pneumophila]
MQFSRHKKLVILVLSLFFMSFLFLFWNIYRLLYTPIIPKTASPMILALDKATSAYQFAYILQDKKLIHSAKFFLLIIRFEGLSHQLKAGVYQITPGETAMKLLHRVVAGDVITQNFTIIEGSTQQKVDYDLRQANYLKYNPEDWAIVKENYPSAEGLLLADTYQYQGGSSSRALLEQAHRNLLNYLNTSWANRSPNLPYKTPYELLIAASIIEKETAIAQRKN